MNSSLAEYLSGFRNDARAAAPSSATESAPSTATAAASSTLAAASSKLQSDSVALLGTAIITRCEVGCQQSCGECFQEWHWTDVRLAAAAARASIVGEEASQAAAWSTLPLWSKSAAVSASHTPATPPVLDSLKSLRAIATSAIFNATTKSPAALSKCGIGWQATIAAGKAQQNVAVVVDPAVLLARRSARDSAWRACSTRSASRAAHLDAAACQHAHRLIAEFANAASAATSVGTAGFARCSGQRRWRRRAEAQLARRRRGLCTKAWTESEQAAHSQRSRRRSDGQGSAVAAAATDRTICRSLLERGGRQAATIWRWQMRQAPEHTARPIYAPSLRIRLWVRGLSTALRRRRSAVRLSDELTQFDGLVEPGHRIPEARQKIIRERLDELQTAFEYDEHGADNDSDWDMSAGGSKDAAADDRASSSSVAATTRVVGKKRAADESSTAGAAPQRAAKKTKKRATHAKSSL